MRRNLQVVGWTLIWSGIFVLGYLGWQLFGTDLITAQAQDEAQVRLAETFQEAPAPEPEQIDTDEYLNQFTVEPGTPETVPFYPEEAPETGEEFAYIRIPRIALDAVLFEGVDTETLKNGPGHMGRTPVPGQPGNAVVSGHRTTYGRPFFDLDQLQLGDRIEVETSIGVHVYEIRDIQIVLPTDVWVTDARPGGWLTLTTCHPKFSARERLIVFAEMVEGPNAEFIALHRQRFG